MINLLYHTKHEKISWKHVFNSIAAGSMPICKAKLHNSGHASILDSQI